MNILRDADEFVTRMLCVLLLMLLIPLIVISLLMLPQWFTEQYDGFMTRCLKEKSMPECHQEWRERDA